MHNLDAFEGLHEDAEQIPVSLLAINLPSVDIFAITGDSPVYVNLTTGDTRRSPADDYVAFVPYAGLKVPALKPFESIEITFSNGDDFWGGINAAGDYPGSMVTI